MIGRVYRFTCWRCESDMKIVLCSRKLQHSTPHAEFSSYGTDGSYLKDSHVHDLRVFTSYDNVSRPLHDCIVGHVMVTNTGNCQYRHLYFYKCRVEGQFRNVQLTVQCFFSRACKQAVSKVTTLLRIGSIVHHCSPNSPGVGSVLLFDFSFFLPCFPDRRPPDEAATCWGRPRAAPSWPAAGAGGQGAPGEGGEGAPAATLAQIQQRQGGDAQGHASWQLTRQPTSPPKHPPLPLPCHHDTQHLLRP